VNILITAPSLDTKNNVSGISSVVKSILIAEDQNYIYFLVGKADQQKRNIFWLLRQFFLPLKLIYSLLVNKIDIVHLNAPLDTLAIVRDFIFLKIAKLLGVKVLLHLHGGKYLKTIPESKWLYLYLKHYFNSADHIVVLSQLEKNLLLRNYDLKIDDITPLENCVSIPDIKHKSSYEKIRIIFLGRFVARKGLFNILEAFSKLIIKRSDFEFYLYGAGPEEEILITQFSHLLSDTFQFKGIVSGNVKSEALLQADIFLLPSHYGEGLPIALLEAMSYGVVPVVTDDGSMATVVMDKVSGYIVEKDNSVMLAAIIEEIIEKFRNNEVENLQNKIIETIKDKYDCKNYSTKLAAVYKAIAL
jgi:glycosyltransferase involved in cell wall biosynthesis